jgi:5-enolpyruvylshikimate-3-phosphate synthase
MAAAVLAAAVGHSTTTTTSSRLSGFRCVATSYPQFAEHLERLAGRRP